MTDLRVSPEDIKRLFEVADRFESVDKLLDGARLADVAEKFAGFVATLRANIDTLEKVLAQSAGRDLTQGERIDLRSKLDTAQGGLQGFKQGFELGFVATKDPRAALGVAILGAVLGAGYAEPQAAARAKNAAEIQQLRNQLFVLLEQSKATNERVRQIEREQIQRQRRLDAARERIRAEGRGVI